jgi:hypothetical protein
MSAIRLYASFALTAMLTLFASPARAQFTGPVNDRPDGERFRIEGAASFWFPSIDLRIASENFGLAGTAIDFKQDLGAEDKGLTDLRIVLKATNRSKFRFEYIPIKYDASKNLQRTIVFNGIKYNINVPVNSTFDWNAYRFIYEYDVASFNRWYAGFILEAKYTDVKVQLAAPGDTEFATAQAPVPAFGGIGRFYVVPAISITGELTGMKLPENLVHNTFAHYVDFDLYGTINFNRFIGAQIGYRSLDVGVTVKSATGNDCPTLAATGTSGCFNLKGPYFGVVARY